MYTFIVFNCQIFLMKDLTMVHVPQKKKKIIYSQDKNKVNTILLFT